jgi:hypothetical protein
MTSAPNLVAGIEESDPPKEPTAVRVAATITIALFSLMSSFL